MAPAGRPATSGEHSGRQEQDGDPEAPASGALGGVTLVGFLLMATTVLLALQLVGQDHLPDVPGHQIALLDAGWAGIALVTAAAAGAAGYVVLVGATWVSPARYREWAPLLIMGGVPVLLLHLGLLLAGMGGR